MTDESYHGHDTETLVEQFAIVRETGAVNMLDKFGVQNVAEQAQCDELVEFLSACDNAEYMAVLERMGAER